jgi:hypothetical protein
VKFIKTLFQGWDKIAKLNNYTVILKK